MNSVSRLQEAEQALFQIFSGIDATVKQNLQRVLKAFRSHRVGVHHFAGVTGYGTTIWVERLWTGYLPKW